MPLVEIEIQSSPPSVITIVYVSHDSILTNDKYVEIINLKFL